jgi:hypothetical protein
MMMLMQNCSTNSESMAYPLDSVYQIRVLGSDEVARTRKQSPYEDL